MSPYEMLKDARTVRQFLREISPVTRMSWKKGGQDPIRAVYVYLLENYDRNPDLLNSQLYKEIKLLNGRYLTQRMRLRCRAADLEKYNYREYGEPLINEDYELMSEVCEEYEYDTKHVIARIKKILSESDVPSKQILLGLKLVVAYLG